MSDAYILGIESSSDGTAAVVRLFISYQRPY